MSKTAAKLSPLSTEKRLELVADAVFEMEESVRSVAGLAGAVRSLIADLPEDWEQAAVYAVARALDTETDTVMTRWEAARTAVTAAQAGEPE